MAGNDTIHGDEAAELAALQRQMMGEQVQPGQQTQPVQSQQNYSNPIPDQPAPNQQVPIPRYEPPPPEFPVEPQAPVQPVQNQGWNSQAPQQQEAVPPGMMAERRRRQDAEDKERRTAQQLEETRLALARVEERTSMLGDVVARGQQEELERARTMPTWDDDPEGFIRETNRRAVEEAVKESLKPLQDKQAEHDAVIEEETRNRQIANHLQAQARQYEQQRPDFRAAYDFYQNARAQDLISQGFSPDRVMAHVEHEERVMAEAHMRDGRNIPEAVYNAAVSRGYRPGQAPPAPTPNPTANYDSNYAQPALQPRPAPVQQYAPQAPNYQPQTPNYAAPAPNYAPPPPQQPYYSGQPPLENMQAGMMAGSHLADVTPGNNMPPGLPTMEQLVNMPEEQLAANKQFVDAHIEGLIRAGH